MTFPDQPPAPQGDQPEHPQPRYGQYAPGHVPAPPGQQAAPAAGQPGPPQGSQQPWGPSAPGQYPPAPGQYPPAPGQYGQPRYGQHGAPPQGAQQPWGPPAPGTGYGGAPGAPLSLRPGIIPLRPLRVGDFFDGAFRAIRHNPKAMLGIPVILAVLVSLAQTAYSWFYLSLLGSVDSWDTSGSSWYDDSTSSGPSDSTIVLLLVAIAAVALLVGFLGVVCNGVIIASVGQSVIGRVAPLSEVWASVRGRRFGGLLLLGLITGGAAVLGEVLVVGLVVAAAFVAVWLAVVVGLVLGACYVVVLPWFLVRMIVVAPAYVLERTTIRVALRRGWRLTYGSFWRIVGIVLLTGVTVYLLSAILSVPAAILLFVAANASTTVAVVTVAIAVVLGTVVETLVLAFAGAMVALLYIDLRIRREALDATLAAAASDLAAGKASRPGPSGATGLL